MNVVSIRFRSVRHNVQVIFPTTTRMGSVVSTPSAPNTKSSRPRDVVFSVTYVQGISPPRREYVGNAKDSRAISTRHVIASIFGHPLPVISSTKQCFIRLRVNRPVNSSGRHTILFMGDVGSLLRHVEATVCVITVRLSNGLTADQVVRARIPTATSPRVKAFQGRVGRASIYNVFFSHFKDSIYQVIVRGGRVGTRNHFLYRRKASDVFCHASAITSQSSGKNFLLRATDVRNSQFGIQNGVATSPFRMNHAGDFRLSLRHPIFQVGVVRRLLSTLTSVHLRFQMRVFVSVGRFNRLQSAGTGIVRPNGAMVDVRHPSHLLRGKQARGRRKTRVGVVARTSFLVICSEDLLTITIFWRMAVHVGRSNVHVTNGDRRTFRNRLPQLRYHVFNVWRYVNHVYVWDGHPGDDNANKQVSRRRLAALSLVKGLFHHWRMSVLCPIAWPRHSCNLPNLKWEGRQGRTVCRFRGMVD